MTIFTLSHELSKIRYYSQISYILWLTNQMFDYVCIQDSPKFKDFIFLNNQTINLAMQPANEKNFIEKYCY